MGQEGYVYPLESDSMRYNELKGMTCTQSPVARLRREHLHGQGHIERNRHVDVRTRFVREDTFGGIDSYRFFSILTRVTPGAYIYFERLVCLP